jgi:hypothetical protein
MLATEPKPSPTGSSPRDGDARGSRPLSSPAAICIAGFTAAIVIGAGIFIAERGELAHRSTSDAIAPIPPVAAPPTSAPAGHAQASSAPPNAPSSAPNAPSSAPNAPGSAPPIATDTARAAAPAASSGPGATPTGAATAAASPPAAPVASMLAPVLPPASLPPQLGYLAVRSQSEARVYVNGVDIGPTNHALETLCGPRYVRIGTAARSGNPPSWLGPGQSVVIGCRAVTEVTAPSPP